MNAQRKHTEGDLPAARHRLSMAVWALCDPQRHQLDDGRWAETPSRYLQLRDSLSGQQNTGQGVARSLPPIWLDAQQLLDEIDTAAAIWNAQPDGVPPTVGRLRVLEAKSWRPQDVKQLEQMSAALEAWAVEIDALLMPEPKWTLAQPCPACERAVVYRHDSAGDLVRQPALQIITVGLRVVGCRCQSCKRLWPKEHFGILAGAIGCPPPQGVIVE